MEALTRAAEIGDYDAVSELTARLKRADTLKNEVERLCEEWQAVFNSEAIDAEPFESPPYDSQTAFGFLTSMICAALLCRPCAHWAAEGGYGILSKRSLTR